MTKFENPTRIFATFGPNRQTRASTVKCPLKTTDASTHPNGTWHDPNDRQHPLKKLFDELKRRQITDYTRSATTSSTSSSTATLPTVLAEVPLFGLTPKPRDKMSDEELRERIQRIQQLRVSPQTFRAAVEEDKEEKQTSKLTNLMSDYL